MDLSAVAHLAAIEGPRPVHQLLRRLPHLPRDPEGRRLGLRRPEGNVRHGRRRGVPRPRAEPGASRPCAAATRTATSSSSTARPATSYYDALPAVVEKYMGKVNEKLGTNYQLFNYYGAPDADRVIVAMGSICDVAEEVIDYMNAHGEKVGLVKVRLYRPFVPTSSLAAIPATAKKIAVLDRTKEPGAHRRAALPGRRDRSGQRRHAGDQVIGGRYGLGSKDTPPASVFAVYEELTKDAPKRQFTIGIVDDVTNLSLPRKQDLPEHRGRRHHRVQVLGPRRRRHRRREQELHQDHRRPYRQVCAGLLPVRLQEDRRRDHQPPALRRQAHQEPVLHQQGRLRRLPQPVLHHQGLQDRQRRQAGRRVPHQLPVGLWTSWSIT